MARIDDLARRLDARSGSAGRFAAAAMLTLGVPPRSAGLAAALKERGVEAREICAPRLGARRLVARVRRFARETAPLGSDAPILLVIEAEYALGGDQIMLRAPDGARLWLAAIGAALAEARAPRGWIVALDGRCGTPSRDAPPARRRVAAALREALGGPETGMLAIARAPGDRSALAPRLTRALAATAFGAGAPLSGGAVPPALRGAADWASRVTSPAAVLSVAPDGRAALLRRPRPALSLPGATLFAPESVGARARLQSPALRSN